MRIPYRIIKYSLNICRKLGNRGLRWGLALQYYYIRGHFPNLKNPEDFSERILSRMCSPEFIKYSVLADKVTVHDFIRSKGLEDILLKHYAVWNSIDDIDITDLPEKFVLKPNNGSGGHVYCRNKSKFDIDKAKQILKENLERAEDYFFEPHYLHIKPLVFAEEFLDLGPGKILTDYKFHCINGKIADVFLAGENSYNQRKYETVDLNWNVLPYTKEEYRLTPLPPKPENLEKMAEYARILSADFPFVRVDFYEYDGKVYFSELTFSPWGGFMYSYTNEALRILGEKFNS